MQPGKENTDDLKHTASHPQTLGDHGAENEDQACISAQCVVVVVADQFSANNSNIAGDPSTADNNLHL